MARPRNLITCCRSKTPTIKIGWEEDICRDSIKIYFWIKAREYPGTKKEKEKVFYLDEIPRDDFTEENLDKLFAIGIKKTKRLLKRIGKLK